MKKNLRHPLIILLCSTMIAGKYYQLTVSVVSITIYLTLLMAGSSYNIVSLLNGFDIGLILIDVERN